MQIKITNAEIKYSIGKLEDELRKYQKIVVKTRKLKLDDQKAPGPQPPAVHPGKATASDPRWQPAGG